MDSILKFADKKENYRRLFGRQVVDVFVDTFQKVFDDFNNFYRGKRTRIYSSTNLVFKCFANKKDAVHFDTNFCWMYIFCDFVFQEFFSHVGAHSNQFFHKQKNINSYLNNRTKNKNVAEEILDLQSPYTFFSVKK